MFSATMLVQVLLLILASFPIFANADDEKFSIIIYTPEDENYRTVSMYTNGELDIRTKADFEDQELSKSKQWKIPHVWTGDLASLRDGGLVPQTFWITDKETSAWNRDMLRCVIDLKEFPKEDIWLYLGSKHSWAFTGKDDHLDYDWLVCDNYKDEPMPFKWPTASHERPK